MKPTTSQYHYKQCISCSSNKLVPFLKVKDYFLTQEVFELVKCENCGLVITNPVPVENEIGKYYDSKEYLSHKSRAQNLTSWVYNSLRNYNIRSKYRFINSFKTGKHILDYGCGSGKLLLYFSKKGWKTQGVEPNEGAREIASKINGVEILDSPAAYLLPKDSVDVITLWHVLEHIHKLNEVVDNLVSVLKRNGILVIAVPNINSPDANKYKEMWAGYDVPRHLYHFSSDSMNKFLAQHNMEVILTKPMKLDAFYVCLLSEKYKGNKFPYPKAFIEGLKSNHRARLENNYSSMIFVARKK